MDDKPYLTQDEMVDWLRRLANLAGAQYKLAEKLGVTPAHLSDMLAGKRAVADDVAEKLGYRREYCYFPLEREPAAA